jgi:arylsulfatase A-like enzyme
VLWICADDHAAFMLGAYGNRQIHTPNLDRLASSGMRFDRAYCNSPVCTPSRLSFMTGRYPRTIGVTQLETPLPLRERTLADLLRDAGYTTAAIGKMPFGSGRHGFDERIDRSTAEDTTSKPSARPLPANLHVLPSWRPFQDAAAVWLNSSYLPYGAFDAKMDGTCFANEAARFLGRDRDRPFFLFVGFYEPHAPFLFPIEDLNRHDPHSFIVPEAGPKDANQIPKIFRDLTKTDKQGILASYATSVEFLDRNVGRVLKALEESGKSKNTLVIYTSDQGYLLGQHGRFEKHCNYEEAVRVPLLLRLPAQVRAGSSTSALVEMIDLVPTVLHFCHVAVPPNVQGRSFLKILTGEKTRHRARVFVEYAPNDEAMVRDEHWKLIYERGKQRRRDGYDTGEPLTENAIRLFDLDRDPGELDNVADRPENAGRVAELLRILARHLKATSAEPGLVPQTDDALVVLDYCVQSRDAGQLGSRVAGIFRRHKLAILLTSLAFIAAIVFAVIKVPRLRAATAIGRRDASQGEI